MKGFVQDIESLAVRNAEFRQVVYTAKHCQLVLMALKPKEEIGAEVHKPITLGPTQRPTVNILMAR